MTRPAPTRSIALLALLAAVCLTLAVGVHKKLSLRAVRAATAITPQPIQYPGFPFPATTIDGWIASNNTADMRAHGWGLWAGLNAITPDTGGLPTFETWYNNTEVQSGPPSLTAKTKAANAAHSRFAAIRSAGKSTHQFEFPEQFHEKRMGFVRHNLAAVNSVETTDLHAQTLTTTMFSSDYAQSIWSNNYQDITPPNSTVWNLQANWGTVTPVSQRIIKPFTAPSISLKPVYQFVNGPTHHNGLTTLKYWLGDLSSGPANSTNPAYPDPTTWNQCVVVNTGSAPNPGNLTCFGTTTPANGMIPISQFYNYPISAAEAVSVCAQFKSGGFTGTCDLQAGDFAILVAMHVSTKENANWTWQSFWFNYDQAFPYGGPPSTVPAPFSNYAMCTAYSMTTNPPNSPSGANTLCYNPYLETGLPAPVQGIHSDCMSCHMVASIGNNPNSQGNTSPRNSFGYATFAGGTNNIDVWNPADDKVFFDCQTTTDLSWFLANWVASAAPAKQAPCVLTAVKKAPPKKN